MRIALALFMIAHGIAHLPGFAVSWRLLESREVPYSTTVLHGSLDLGADGIRIYGVLWLLAGISFVAMGTALLLRVPWWYQGSLWIAGASLLLCLTALPAASVGLAANLLFVAALFAMRAASGAPTV